MSISLDTFNCGSAPAPSEVNVRDLLWKTLILGLSIFHLSGAPLTPATKAEYLGLCFFINHSDSHMKKQTKENKNHKPTLRYFFHLHHQPFEPPTSIYYSPFLWLRSQCLLTVQAVNWRYSGLRQKEHW